MQSTPTNISGELKFGDPRTASLTTLKQTFAQAKLLNPQLTRKAFDLGQQVARAFLAGTNKPPAGSNKPAKLPQGLSLQGRFNLAELRLANAQLTATQADDRRILVTEAAILRQQLAQTKTLKDRTAVAQTLAGIVGQIQSIDAANAASAKQAAQAAKDAAKAARERAKAAKELAQTRLQTREFKVLGLDASGQPFAPKLGGLRSELAGVRKTITGSADTKTNEGILGNINKLLFGKDAHSLTKDVRSTVKQMLDAIKDEIKNAGGPETRFQVINTRKFLSGLGLHLTPAQEKAARARLSQLGAGGTVPQQTATGGNFGGQTITVHTNVKLDGRQVGTSVTKHQQKRRLRNPEPKRGPHAAGGL